MKYLAKIYKIYNRPESVDDHGLWCRRPSGGGDCTCHLPGQPPTDAIDYAALNQGIRETVRFLRRNGFRTTDSGDGKTNVEAGMEGAIDEPHVVSRSTVADVVEEARRLWAILTDLGLESAAFGEHGGGKFAIEAHYDVGAIVSTITLWGVDDDVLRATPAGRFFSSGERLKRADRMTGTRRGRAAS